MTENPFFEHWTTPFGMPPFDRIRPEHFPPAFDRGMQEQIAETAAIAGSATPPSFADTIEALERSGRLLERVSRVFFNLDASNTDDALEAIARDYAPRLAQHQMRIALDPDLFSAHRRSPCKARKPRAGPGPAAADRALLPPFRAQRRPVDAPTEAAHGSNYRALGEPAYPFWTECPARRAGLAAGARRGRSRRASRICPSRGGASRRRARQQWPLCRDPDALRGRAVSDIFGPPRPAPHIVGGVDRPRRTRRRRRQRTDHRRDHGFASRAGPAARL